MRTIDNEEATFETIEEHIYQFDWPDVMALHFEPYDSEQFLARAFTIARPILQALVATPLISEKWQTAIDLLVRALDEVSADAKDSASPWDRDLPVF